MSEALPDRLPGFEMLRRKELIDGVDSEVLEIGFNARTGRRRIIARVLDMGTQWDVLEIIGRGLDNPGWVNLAMASACVLEVDGKPVLGAMSRDRFRKTLNLLGDLGVMAVNRGLSIVAAEQLVDEAAEKAAVGN